MSFFCFKLFCDFHPNQNEAETALSGNMSDKHFLKRLNYAICISQSSPEKQNQRNQWGVGERERDLKELTCVVMQAGKSKI